MPVHCRAAALPRRALLGLSLLAAGAAPAAGQTLDYQTITFDGLPTFVTGIRDGTLTGQVVIPSGGSGTANGGFLYSTATGSFTPYPVATPSGVNFPGAIDNTPYGPSFGSPGGILRVVGSYQTAASSPYGIGYLYDSAKPAGSNLTTLQYPNPPGDTTLFTIAHSTFGDQVVGNYDTQLAGGNAFLYTISTGTWATNDKPGASSTTAYGVWGNLIAGGYTQVGGSGLGVTHGYIYNQSTNVWTTIDFPGAVATHFEGITGGGRAGTYNLVADWLDAQGNTHAAVLHLDAAGNASWTNISVPGAISTSVNSIYGDEVIGVYVMPGNTVQAFTVIVPGIYNPITNSGTLSTSASGTPALTGTPGDDVINTGVITTSGVGSAGISGNTYGVVTNAGQVSVSGAGSAAVLLNGTEGTLLNTGLLRAAPGAYAIATGAGASGSVVVNQGTIDGAVNFSAGALARFENSGWLGITDAGTGVRHMISGTFAQSGTGTLALRVDQNGNHDALAITGSGQLGGTLTLVTQPGLYGVPVSYANLITASGSLWGSFSTVDASSPFFSVSLSDPTSSIGAELTRIPFNGFAGLTPNEAAVASVLEQGFQRALASGTNLPLYESLLTAQGTAADVPTALDALSGAGLTGVQQTTLVASSSFVEALRRQGGFWLSGFGAAPGAVEPEPHPWRAWATAIGGDGRLDGGSGTAPLSINSSGGVAGLEFQPIPDVLLGAAVGGSSSGYSASGLDTSGSLAGVQAGLYALGRWRGFYASGILAYGHYHGDNTRDVSVLSLSSVATSGFDDNALTGHVEAGYGLKAAAATVTPFVAYEGAAVWEPAFSETVSSGGLPVGLSVAGETTQSHRSFVGVELDHALPLAGDWTLQNAARAAWVHEFDTTRAMTASFEAFPSAGFTVLGAPAASDSALLTDTVFFSRGSGLAVFAAVDADASGQGHMVGGRIGLQVGF